MLRDERSAPEPVEPAVMMGDMAAPESPTPVPTTMLGARAPTIQVEHIELPDVPDADT